MADNIMGPEVNLGLNVNLELDRSAQDAATLADQIKQMRIDQEAFRDVIADTQDRLREMTSNYQEQLSLRQQLLETETALRNISDSRTDSLKDQVAAYRDMEGSMTRLASSMGQTTMGGGYGMQGMMPYGGYLSGYMGNYMGGYYNPMQGMMMNYGGYPSMYSPTPRQEQSNVEQAKFGNKKSIFTKVEEAADKAIYGDSSPNNNNDTDFTINARNVYINGSMASGGGNGSILDDIFGGGSNGGGGGGGGGNNLPIPGGPNWDFGGGGGSGSAGNPGFRYTLSSVLKMPGIGGLLKSVFTDSAGALGGMELGPEVAAATLAGREAYKIGSNIATTGQAYGSLTGTPSPVGGYGMQAQSFLGSFLNPLLPSRVSQAIESTGLGSGYQFGSNWLNQYRGFASGAYERYGISPQESQQMFQNGSVVGGASGDQLSAALQAVGQSAADNSMPFQQQVQLFNQNLSTFGGNGLTGNALAAAASMQASEFSGGAGQILSPIQGQLSQFSGSMMGQALMANALGIPVTQMYNWQKSLKGGTGGAQYLAAENKAFTPLLEGLGLHAGSSMKQIGGDAMQLQATFASMGMNMSEKQAVTFANQMLNNQAGMAKNIAKADPNKQNGGGGGGFFDHVLGVAKDVMNPGHFAQNVMNRISGEHQYAKEQKHVVEVYLKGDLGKVARHKINQVETSMGLSNSNSLGPNSPTPHR